jgi:hypothetical protein
MYVQVAQVELVSKACACANSRGAGERATNVWTVVGSVSRTDARKTGAKRKGSGCSRCSLFIGLLIIVSRHEGVPLIPPHSVHLLHAGTFSYLTVILSCLLVEYSGIPRGCPFMLHKEEDVYFSEIAPKVHNWPTFPSYDLKLWKPNPPPDSSSFLNRV